MSHRPLPGRRSLLRGSLAASAALTLPTAVGAAPALALSGRPRAAWGVQSGDVTSDSGLVWVRSDRPARMIVETAATESFRGARRLHGPLLGAGTDFTGTLRLRGLPSGEQIHYRVLLADPDDPRRTGETVTGAFRTVPSGAGAGCASCGPGTSPARAGASTPTSAATASTTRWRVSTPTSSCAAATTSTPTAR